MKDKMAEQVLAGLNRKVSATAGFAPPSSGGPTPRDTKTQEQNNAYKYFNTRTAEIKQLNMEDEEIQARKTPLNPTGGPTTKELRKYASDFGVEFIETKNKDGVMAYFIDGTEYGKNNTVMQLVEIVEARITNNKDNIISGYKRKQVGGGGAMTEFNQQKK
jgi:hypothetical protein